MPVSEIIGCKVSSCLQQITLRILMNVVCRTFVNNCLNTMLDQLRRLINERTNKGRNRTIIGDLKEFSREIIQRLRFIASGEGDAPDGSPYKVGKKQNYFSETKEVSPSIVGELKDFCSETTIHGLRYIGREGAGIFDRLLNFTLLEIETDDSLRTDVRRILALLSKFQYPYFQRSLHEDYPRQPMTDILDTIKLSEFILRIMPQCQDVFFECYWLAEFFNCCDVFSIQRSEAGFCYSFNSSVTDEFFFDHSKEVSSKDYTCNPRRNIAAGTTTGLEVYMIKISDQDSLGQGQLFPNGNRIMINHPLVPPEVTKTIYVQGMKATSFQVKISPTITMASQDIRGMSLEEQGVPECKFSQLRCIHEINDYIRVFNPPNGGHILQGKYKTKVINCTECLPTCHESKYNVD
ncbi:hypothetical protein C0J52_00510 [Blattella germanica]|nr:hypothetical protein C0J52_00510 [Blattella germanica]